MSNISVENSSSSPSNSAALNGDSSQDIINILNYVDLTVRVVSALTFVAYFALVAFKRELRKANLFYVHNANFVNLAWVLIFIGFFNSTAPNFSSDYLNHVFCVLIEILFGWFKYLRSYSVLLIAIYRFNAVFFINFHRQLHKRSLYVFLPVLATWTLTLLLALASKYAFQTTYSASLCMDGYSDVFANLVNYLITTSVLSILVPFILTMIIYYLIKHKLSQNTRLSNNSAKKQSKDQRFTTQLIAINVCYIISFLISFVQTFRFIIPDFNTRLYYLRQGLRILNLSSVALLPLISIYFNPMITFRSIKSSFVETIIGKASTKSNTN